MYNKFINIQYIPVHQVLLQVFAAVAQWSLNELNSCQATKLKWAQIAFEL
jgi:hypothetical protein